MKYHMPWGFIQNKQCMGTDREYQIDTSDEKQGNYPAHVSARFRFYCIVNLADINS